MTPGKSAAIQTLAIQDITSLNVEDLDIAQLERRLELAGLAEEEDDREPTCYSLNCDSNSQG